MARRRFFVPQVRRGVAEISGNDAEHLVRVLRAEVGQVYEISDNQDLYLARIDVARKSLVSFQVIEKLEVAAPSGRLILAPALFKFDHFEWMVEKATELGVDQIAPFEAARTERGLMQAAFKRKARWERIALEASQQARRDKLPTVAESVRFEAAVNSQADIRLMLDEDAAVPAILDVLPQARVMPCEVTLLVGPEGGWLDAERALALEKGWLACSLGPTVLRAETAAIAGLSILRAWFNQRQILLTPGTI